MASHMIFDIKIYSEFTSKEIFVVDGHKVDTLPSMTYTLVLPRDSVWVFDAKISQKL